MMVNDNEIVMKLRDILMESDLSSITINMIISQLEEHYQCDLQEKRTMLRDSLNAYIQEKLESDNIFQDDDDDEDDVNDKINTEDYENDDNDDINESKIDDDGDDKPSKKKGGGGFTRPVQLSTDLSAFVGGDVSLARTEVTKRLWAYIKENNLQNPNDKREILCDATLEKLFKRKKINMFKMTKALAPMMKAVESLQEAPTMKSKSKSTSSSNSSPKPKSKAVKSEGSSSSKAGKNSKEVKTEKVKKEKKEKGGGNGFTAVCSLSQELSGFLGIDELPRTQVVSKLWEYIKANNLQNPNDKREIILDKKMKGVFVGLDTITMFSMNKHLAKHIFKKD